METQPWPRAKGVPLSLRWFAVIVCVTAVLGNPQPAEDASEEVSLQPEEKSSTGKVKGFVFTAPKRLLAESNETVCLSLHNIPGSGHVYVDLLNANSDEKIASVQHKLKPGKGACMELYVPPTSQVKGRIQLKAHFDELYDYTINSVKEIHIEQNPYVFFIETDKPVYKPGQEVKFRVMTVKHNFSPVKGPIRKVWIENPSGVRMAQWLDVPTELGLAQLNFQLSPEPVQGNWKIKVQRNKNHTVQMKSFEVKEYVLPKFEVLIKPPSFISADFKEITWKICAKYSYGKPVKGEMNVTATPIIPSWRLMISNLPQAYGKSELDRKDGCANFTVIGGEIGLLQWDISPESILINASVKEHGTDEVQSSSLKSKVTQQALKLEFLPHSLKYFKPGLPYKGKLQVLRPDSIPVEGEEIQVCLKVNERFHWRRTLVECKNFTSNSDGFVEFIVPPQDKGVTLLLLVATAVRHHTKYYSPDKRWRVLMHQPSDLFDVESWYSPSDSYIEVADWDNKALECNTRHLVNVYFTVDANVTRMEFHYLVKSRGDIVQYGHKIHQPSNRNHQELTDFPNLLGGNQNASQKTDEDEDKSKKIIMDKFSFKLHISPKMSPISDLLIYYIRDDGETVATSHTIKIEKCFANEVNAKWSDTTLFPGSQSKFKLEATPKSLCAVTAVDKSVSFFGTQNQVDETTAFQQIERFRIDASSPPRQADDWEYCGKKKNKEGISLLDPLIPMEETDLDLRRRRRRYSIIGPSSKYVDAVKAFDDAGLLVISDATLHTRPCVDPYVDIHDRCNPCPFQNVRFASVPIRGRTAISGDRRRSRTRFANHALAEASPLSVHYSQPRTSFDEESVEMAYGGTSDSSVVEVRSFFPETWLWDLVHVGEDGTAELENEVPHTITEWIGHATCLSSETGLGTSLASNLNAFQPFFLEMTMPYSVKRGEILRLKVSIFNFLSHSLPVKITLEQSQGLEILGNNTFGYCVEDRGSLVTEFRLKMTELGEVNMTVSAQVDELFPEPCGPELLISRRDVMIKPIIVKPEGYPVEITNSSFVCASESEEVILYWNLELPSDLVEGSARAEVSTMGDLLGPSLENLDGLVQLPMGCGEQNMILFVPNIHVLDYLESTNQVNPVLRSKAITNMEKGYQRELLYRHNDGSYSAFGKSDSEGSMWLTAFVVKSFAQARKFIFVDKEDLKISMRWITKRQLENGCFPFVGKVFHKDIKGGLSGESSSVAFSAYVLTALLETGIEMSPSVLSNALYCLTSEDRESTQSQDMYTLALTTYALSLAGPNQTEKAQHSLDLLLEMATREKDLLWWNKAGTSSLGMNIEITAYAILSLVKLGGEENLIHAFQAVRWISQQRNSHGGFVSTQDTVVALEALSKYATVFMNDGNAKNTNLSINVKTADFENTFIIHDEVRLLLHHREIPMLPTGVEVTASGSGCALVQTSLKYNVKTAKGSDAFDINVKTTTSVDSCTIQKMEICTRYKLTDESSNMAVMEIDMVSGYIPMKETLEKLKSDPTLNLKRWEESKNQVNLYFDELSSTRTCIRFLVQQESKVENPKPATVKVYDYYQQELSVSTDYNFPEGCDLEKLPNPVPAQFDNDFGDVVIVDTPAQLSLEEMKTSTSIVEGSKGVLKVNSSNIPIGLNPAFINVDHDLEFPDGIEGPSPIYTSPQADSSRHHQEKDECPLCMDSAPDNFAKIYCSSRNAYKVAVRKFLNAKILMALSPGRRARKFNKPIMFTVKKSCSCIHIHKAGGHILVLNINDGNFNDNKPHVKIGSSTLVIPIPQSPGQPSIVRSARSSCK